MENVEKATRIANFKSVNDILNFYKIKYQRTEFFDCSQILSFNLSESFLEDLKFSLNNVGDFDKEFFLSEFVIVPFLKEIWKKHQDLKLFSHTQLKTADFTVIPDYIIAAKTESGYKTLEKPLLITVEAKFEQFIEGWFQATLQSVAAREINQDENIPIWVIVTTGEVWEFGKLDKNYFYQHPFALSLVSPQKVAGVLDFIFAECEKFNN